MILDLRSDEERYDDVRNIPRKSLAVNLNIYSEKPAILNHKRADKYWFPSVHQLRGQDAIMFICGLENDTVDFAIYNAKYPYKV